MVATWARQTAIKVNGRRVPEAALEPGDEVTVGLVKLRFERE